MLDTRLLGSDQLLEFHLEHFLRWLRSQLASKLAIGHHGVQLLAGFVIGQFGREPGRLVKLVHRAPNAIVVMPHLIFALIELFKKLKSFTHFYLTVFSRF